MGFDCTLHLVNEQAIRDEFVPRLLGRTQAETALDRVVKDAAKNWDIVRNSLENGDPEEAASLVCQLAVMFSACSLPHQYERGFALCMWQEQGENTSVEYPEEFAFSPESLFAEVVAKYPSLAGRFPTWFAGNYSTGVYIPSDHVSEVLAWAEKVIANFKKGDQRKFKGLLRILRAAVTNNLAYWEATDLAIPMTGQSAGDPKLMIASYLGNEPGTTNQSVEEAPVSGHFRSLGCKTRGRWLISADYDPFVTNFWDMSVWPPRLVYSLPEFASHLDYSRDGRWLLFSETNADASPRTFCPRLFSDLSGKVDGEFPLLVKGAGFWARLFSKQSKLEPQSVRDGGFVGNRPVVYPDPQSNLKVGDVVPCPLWLEGKSWKPLAGLPAVLAGPSALPGWVETPVTGIIHLADGSDVLLWDGDGYELIGDQFEKQFIMRAKSSQADWTYACAGPDGFFYLSERRLFEIHRNGTAVSHVNKWSNIMSIGTGPDGSLLLKEGNNDDGDVAKLYFPMDGTYIHIEPELFDDKDYPCIYWSAESDRFLVLAGNFLSVRTSMVLSLPRYHAETGKPVKK